MVNILNDREASCEREETAREKLVLRIQLLLIDMGAPPALKGFGYLCRAIELVYDNADSIHNVVNGLYSQIAGEYGTTAQCVERNCRTFLSAAWRCGEHERIEEYFPCTFHCREKPPTTKEFIAVMADVMRRNYRV